MQVRALVSRDATYDTRLLFIYIYIYIYKWSIYKLKIFQRQVVIHF
ncbi:MAG: hypothetical protein MCS20_01175 [Candidatus Phytoplasma mali]|nr:hypothetical protein [Candidatus Phytoplasma mali]